MLNWSEIFKNNCEKKLKSENRVGKKFSLFSKVLLFSYQVLNYEWTISLCKILSASLVWKWSLTRSDKKLVSYWIFFIRKLRLKYIQWGFSWTYLFLSNSEFKKFILI